MDATLFTETFRCRLANEEIVVTVEVTERFLIHLTWQWQREVYQFTVNRWCGGKLDDLLCLFHLHNRADRLLYGTYPEMTFCQKKNIVMKSCRDLFTLLDAVIREYPNSLLGYAYWFTGQGRLHCVDYYSEIHELTCFMIVETRVGVFYNIFSIKKD